MYLWWIAVICLKQQRYTNTEYLSGQNQNFCSNISTWLSSVALQQEAGVPELLKCSLLLSQMYYHLELRKKCLLHLLGVPSGQHETLFLHSPQPLGHGKIQPTGINTVITDIWWQVTPFFFLLDLFSSPLWINHELKNTEISFLVVCIHFVRSFLKSEINPWDSQKKTLHAKS